MLLGNNIIYGCYHDSIKCLWRASEPLTYKSSFKIYIAKVQFRGHCVSTPGGNVHTLKWHGRIWFSASKESCESTKVLKNCWEQQTTFSRLISKALKLGSWQLSVYRKRKRNSLS